MILSSTQFLKADGMTVLTFRTTTAPSSAQITWEGGTRTASVTYDADSESYSLTALIPAEVFKVKLDTEPRWINFESEWGEKLPEDFIELEYYGEYIFLVPYCDLAGIDLKFYTRSMVPLETWDSGIGKKSWYLNSILVMPAYGGDTLIATVSVYKDIAIKEQGGTNWTYLDDLPGGFIVELTGHSRVTNDLIVNSTICRDSLYEKTYRKEIIK